MAGRTEKHAGARGEPPGRVSGEVLRAQIRLDLDDSADPFHSCQDVNEAGPEQFLGYQDRVALVKGTGNSLR